LRPLPRFVVAFAAVAAGLLVVLAAAPRPQPAFFTDVTAAVKLDFRHEPHTDKGYFMPDIMGSGAAFLDYDNDGRLDIFFVQGGHYSDHGRTSPLGNRLFHQEADGTFRDVSAGSGLAGSQYGVGVVAADFDNDGLVDIFVTNFGPNALYRNRGGGRFEDVTARAGVAGDGGWSTSATACDYDRDGYLDLYVARYVVYDPAKPCFAFDGSPEYCSPKVKQARSDLLFHNNGNGTFTDVSRSSGIASTSLPGLGVVCADFNGDGIPDFFVANDGKPNQLWIGDGKGHFTDEAMAMGAGLNAAGQAESGMGIAVGDINNDGYLDLFVTHMTTETNLLYLNDGKSGFDDISVRAGMTRARRTGFGAAFFDFDHDGDLDIAVANGRAFRMPTLPGAALGAHWNPYVEPNLLLENDGRGLFTDVSASAGAFGADLGLARGLAVGDYDNDGDLDLLVTYTAGPARLFRNDAPKKGHWLMVRAFDPKRKRDAYGAVVTATAGSRKWMRLANPGYSYLVSNDPRAHFGFPADVARVDRITVRWPDGSDEEFPGVAVDRLVTLNQGQGRRLR
jgi:enediyne biosynthesis protein E4